jgi:23S rRNA G2445 N2-methylase RlmL
MTYGSTLSQDGFRTQQFDFVLSNPPYGKSWKTDLERMGRKSLKRLEPQSLKIWRGRWQPVGREHPNLLSDRDAYMTGSNRLQRPN